MTFTKLKELVETTETATDVAISGSKALLRQLMNRQLYEWVGVDNTDESEDDGKDSPLKHDADSIESFNTTADGSEGDGDDSALRHNTGEIEDFDIHNLFNITGGDPCDIVDSGQGLREKESSLAAAMRT